MLSPASFKKRMRVETSSARAWYMSKTETGKKFRTMRPAAKYVSNTAHATQKGSGTLRRMRTTGASDTRCVDSERQGRQRFDARSFRLKFAYENPDSGAMNRVVLGWLIGVFALGFFALCPPHVEAQVQMRAVDQSTVRVFALSGVDAERVRAVRTRSGVVLPSAVLPAPRVGHGSGVIIEANGLIATARHVVSGADLIAVLLPGSSEVHPARIVLEDAEHDVALILMADPPDTFLPVPATDPALQTAQPVIISGYPFDASEPNPAVSTGSISRSRLDGTVELSASVNPGNSGGPVTTQDGTLIGILVAGANVEHGAQGFAMFEPLSCLRTLLQRMSTLSATGPLLPPVTLPADRRALELLTSIVMRTERSHSVEGAELTENELPISGEALRLFVNDAAQLQQMISAAQNPASLALYAIIAWYRGLFIEDANSASFRALARDAATRALTLEPIRSSERYAGFRAVNWRGTNAPTQRAWGRGRASDMAEPRGNDGFAHPQRDYAGLYLDVMAGLSIVHGASRYSGWGGYSYTPELGWAFSLAFGGNVSLAEKHDAYRLSVRIGLEGDVGFQGTTTTLVVAGRPNIGLQIEAGSAQSAFVMWAAYAPTLIMVNGYTTDFIFGGYQAFIGGRWSRSVGMGVRWSHALGSIESMNISLGFDFHFM